MNILGLCGLAGSGKSTCAGFLKEAGYQEIAFADVMKRFAHDVFQFSDEQLWGPSSAREGEDVRFRRDDGKLLTPRYCLQILGTEFGRHCYPDVWINYAIRTAFELLNGPASARYTPQTGIVYTSHGPKPKGVIFSDCRFKNELISIRRAGGRVLRLKRGMPTDRAIAWRRMTSKLPWVSKTHASEWNQLLFHDHDFDAVIDNRRTMGLDQLRREVLALA